MSPKDPAPLAVAMRYEAPAAPVVTAKGRGEVAESILEMATRHGIPLYDDPQLAGMLAEVPLGEEIPAALYAAVAEVIAFVYLMADRIESR